LVVMWMCSIQISAWTPDIRLRNKVSSEQAKSKQQIAVSLASCTAMNMVAVCCCCLLATTRLYSVTSQTEMLLKIKFLF
jgi:hypothetical protein